MAMANAKPSVTETDLALRAEIERLMAENRALRDSAAKGSKLSFKVSRKGGVSVYGLGRWPVTHYRKAWETLLAHGNQLMAFIELHAEELSTGKDDPRFAGVAGD